MTNPNLPTPGAVRFIATMSELVRYSAAERGYLADSLGLTIGDLTEIGVQVARGVDIANERAGEPSMIEKPVTETEARAGVWVSGVLLGALLERKAREAAAQD